MAFNDDEEPPPAKPGPARPMQQQVQLTKYHNPKAPLAPNDQKVVLELKGVSSAASRAPLDLVAVIDVSGSMERGGKLENAKKALRFITRKLTNHDRLSIVRFDHEAARVCPLRCATEAAHAELDALVGSLEPRGATNIQAGLETGLDVLRERRFSTGRAANIMLMSDGGQNEGDARKIEPGDVPVHTFGFSSGHDTTLMDEIAKKSLGGVYNFVDDESDRPTNLSETFSQVLAGLVTIIAQDLELTVTPFLDEATISKVEAGSYPVDMGTATGTGGSSSNSVTVRFGTLYCTEARKVIVELALKDHTAFRPYNANVADVRYRFSFAGQQVTSNPERITIRRSRRAAVAPPPQVQAEVARRQHADSIKAAMEKADGDKLEDARSILAEALKALERIADPMVDMLRKELLKLLELFKTPDAYERQGRPSAMSSVASHDRQRFTARGDAEDIRIFATRRMDTYLGQAKQPDDKPIPSADDDVQEEPPEVPRAQDVLAGPRAGKRTLALALRLVTVVLSLVAFSIMASTRTSAWNAGSRYEPYRLVTALPARCHFLFLFLLLFLFLFCHLFTRTYSYI
jgi:hypothetical protein